VTELNIPLVSNGQRLVNVGCGRTFHPAWENLDLFPADPSVRQINILHGLPYQTATVDACYSSHVLEHLRQADAIQFISEQFRVLKAGGIIRVAVPDLEVICRNYLTYLVSLANGTETDDFNYVYTSLELFDQVTRETSGGELHRFIQNLPELDVSREKFLQTRLHQGAFETGNLIPVNKLQPSFYRRILCKVKRIRYRLAEAAVKLLLGDPSVISMRRGLFRDSGEVHHVMYDRYSLYRLLSSHGFDKIKCRDAGDSDIPEFSSYALEVSGAALLKPDSLYMEAVKP